MPWEMVHSGICLLHNCKDLRLDPSTYVKRLMWQYLPIIPELERWNNVDPWISLSLQSSQIGELQA